MSDSPCCHKPKRSIDYLLWSTLLAILFLYAYATFFADTTTHEHFSTSWLTVLSVSVHDMVHTIWWGVLTGIVMIAILSRVPREFVMSILGADRGLKGMLHATAAGIFLDLCSHGILMVGSKLYERGASIGQVMAFLIASPWNSFSLTLVLIALIGLPWTLVFILLSMLIAIATGLLFNYLEDKQWLPSNPHSVALPDNFHFWPEAKIQWQSTQIDTPWIMETVMNGVRDSRMVLRWIFLGILLASLIRTFIQADDFAQYFGPTLLGLIFTMIAATIIEVCSEGSTPIAADLVTRAHAPGNGFAFLMAGVATDYTEVMVVKETTRSWKIALFMPLLTLPQVFVIAWLLNYFS